VQGGSSEFLPVAEAVLICAARAGAASGAVAALQAKADALDRRLEGLLRCKVEFAELARCL
jgi:hypothetical protein